MKQKLLLLAMGLFAFTGSMMADDVYYTVESVDVMQGKTAKVTMYYDADGTKEYKGFQVEFNLPDGLHATAVELSEAIKANNPAMTLEFNDRRPSDQKSVFLGFQIALTPMPMGDQVELFSYYVTADETCELGSYPVATTKIEFASDVKAEFGPKTITYNVIPYAVRELADTDENLPASSEAPEDVLVKRTVKADVWSTICLPFSMTAEQVNEVFGEASVLADFTSTEVSDDEKTITVYFTTVDDKILEPNHPYVIKSANEMEEFKVEDAFVQADETEATLYPQGGTPRKPVYYGAFHGTLKQCQAISEDEVSPIVYLQGNKFWFSNEPFTMKAFRGYFELYDFVASESSNINFVIDGEATSIEGININGKEIANGDVYSVNGMYMGRAENVMNTLPRGMYIINNKKVVVK